MRGWSRAVHCWGARENLSFGFPVHQGTVFSKKVKTRLYEVGPAARGSGTRATVRRTVGMYLKSALCLSVRFVGVISPPVQSSNPSLQKRNQFSNSYATQQCAELLLWSLRLYRPDLYATYFSLASSWAGWKSRMQYRKFFSSLN